VPPKVHDLTIKTRPSDKEKIALIRDLISRYVDVPRILAAVDGVRDAPTRTAGVSLT